MSLWQCFFLGYSLSCYPIWAQPCSAVLKYFLIEIGKRKVVPLVEWKFIHLIWGTKCDRLHRFATFNATYYWGRFNGIGRSPSGDTDGHIHFRNFCCLWQKPTWIYSFLVGLKHSKFRAIYRLLVIYDFCEIPDVVMLSVFGIWCGSFLINQSFNRRHDFPSLL